MSRDWKLMYRELAEVNKNLQRRLERAEAALRRISKGIDDPRTTQNIAASALEAGDECVHESDGLIYTSNPPKNKCKKCGEYYRGVTE